MSKLGAVFLTASILAATPASPPPLPAAEAPHRIDHEAAWGCRDKSDLIDLLFLGLSASFDTTLASALADGRCVYFTPGENVVVVEPGSKGLIRIERPGATPVAYWTPLRNVN